MKNDKEKYEKALRYEIFEKGEYIFIKDKIEKSDCIFDIWWHIWYFSQWCRLYNQKAKIHYFEPITQLYNQAKVNLKWEANILFNNLWISVKSGKWEILYNHSKTMQSSKFSSFLNPQWEIQTVEFISLWEYVEKNQIDKIDVLKMDIEWMEFEVLTSWTEKEWNIIDNFVAEIHLLNDEMKKNWLNIYSKLKINFKNIEKYKSGYRDEIFLIRCQK